VQCDANDFTPSSHCSESLGRLAGPSLGKCGFTSLESAAGSSPSEAAALLDRGGMGATAPILLIRPALFRARIEPGFTFPGSKRSPYRAPFPNVLKSALFWRTDEIKRSYKRVLWPDLRQNGHLFNPGKRG
jgi:hypothetical protein